MILLDVYFYITMESVTSYLLQLMLIKSIVKQ